MDTTIQRKPGQLWLAPKSMPEADDEELYVLIRESPGNWLIKCWDVIRFRNKYHDQMTSRWSEEAMSDDELVLDAQ